jgi:hypothetical protein
LFSQPDKGGVDGGAPKWKISRVNYSEVLILTDSSNPLTGLFSGGLLGLGAFADPSLIVALCCISLVAVGNSWYFQLPSSHMQGANISEQQQCPSLL